MAFIMIFLIKEGKLSTEDFPKIEAKMHEIIKRGDKIQREEWDRDEAIKYFKSIGENYKAEIISEEGKLSTEDFPKIEAKMHEIIKRGDKIQREEWDRDEAIKYFKSIGENYKAEIISDLPKDEVISLWSG
jgi:threonyl-tRNA synthetase